MWDKYLERVRKAEGSHKFEKRLVILDERLRFIVLERSKGKTLSEIAKVLPRKDPLNTCIIGTGVGPERLRQLEAKAINLLLDEADRGPGSSMALRYAGGAHLKE